ncbi:hypothetical protein CVU37_08110 [candidate division BRC1 bacterium HGW-BRC1-1]|jgi:bacterioferritin (cytochrome b1)|nr:MAG: hypothetical protein CVU37_08110 [candidate division BRC1 bacterium HGW-BRC1-1]
MLTAPQLIDHLQILLTRKTFSFAHYITISSPYVAPDKASLWDLAVSQAAEDHEAALAVGRLIMSLGGVPQPGIFDELVADTNYLSISYMMKELLRRRLNEVAETEKSLPLCDGYPAARECVLKIWEIEKLQIEQIKQAVAAAMPPPEIVPEPSAKDPANNAAE